MSKFTLIFIAAFVVGLSAVPISNRIFAGTTPPTNPQHACVILVRDEPLSPQASLGAGSIISARHVITVASLVVTGTHFQIGHGWATTGLLRKDATTAMIAPGFDPVTFANDLAIIVLPAAVSSFNLASPRISAISITTDTAVPSAGPWKIIGWGFTTPGGPGMSAVPYEAAQDFVDVDTCEEAFTAVKVDPENQFCGVDANAAVCPGDNGAGLYKEEAGGGNGGEGGENGGEGGENGGTRADEPTLTLVGVCSNIPTACAADTPVVYTAVGPFSTWITDIIGPVGAASDDTA